MAWSYNLRLEPGQQTDCYNDVLFGPLSRKRSSNWRPPGKVISIVPSNGHRQIKGYRKRRVCQLFQSPGGFQLNSQNIHQNQSYIFKRHVIPNRSTFAGDIETDNRPDENKHEWPRSRHKCNSCLLYTSPRPRDATLSRMPSSA